MTMTYKTYSELISIPTFEERFNYLSLSGIVGDRTFGGERYLNQQFYTSQAWRRARQAVIVRDNGCDLAFPDREIYGNIYIHHINPLTPNDFKNRTAALLNPENLISVTHQTHNAIHYGDINQLAPTLVERRPGDTKRW